MARHALTPEQWAALRQLAEGEPPTHGLLAAAVNIHASTLSHRAQHDAWRSLDFRHMAVRVLHAHLVACAAAIRAGEPLPTPPAAAFADALKAYAPDAFASAGARDEAPAKDEAALAGMAVLPQAERLSRVAAILAARIETFLIGVEAGAELDPKQVAALSALVQLAERITAMGEQQAAAEAVATDREIADAIAILDAQILRHAHAETRRLLVETFGLDPKEVDAKLPAVA